MSPLRGSSAFLLVRPERRAAMGRATAINHAAANDPHPGGKVSRDAEGHGWSHGRCITSMDAIQVGPADLHVIHGCGACLRRDPASHPWMTCRGAVVKCTSSMDDVHGRRGHMPLIHGWGGLVPGVTCVSSMDEVDSPESHMRLIHGWRGWSRRSSTSHPRMRWMDPAVTCVSCRRIGGPSFRRRNCGTFVHVNTGVAVLNVRANADRSAQTAAIILAGCPFYCGRRVLRWEENGESRGGAGSGHNCLPQAWVAKRVPRRTRGSGRRRDRCRGSEDRRRSVGR
jgi:hypothetical protein